MGKAEFEAANALTAPINRKSALNPGKLTRNGYAHSPISLAREPKI
jgi:hypothetical protein